MSLRPRGIDFTFRLERFADDTHIVANVLLVEQLARYSETAANGGRVNGSAINTAQIKCLSIGGERHDVICCRKNIKGWDEAQEFCLLISEGIDERLSPKGLPERGDVEAELFKYYVELVKTPKEDAKDKDSAAGAESDRVSGTPIDRLTDQGNQTP